MGQLTNYSLTSLIKHLSGMQAFTKPTTYIGLFSTPPTSVENTGTELSGNGYARVTVGSTAWSISEADNLIYNNANIVFPRATANWSAVLAVGVFDAATSGNLLWFTDIESIVIKENEKLVIPEQRLILKYFSSTVFSEQFFSGVVSQYEVSSSPETITVTRDFDSSFGYQNLGCLKLQVAANTASGLSYKDVLSTENVSVNPNEKYSMVFQYYTTNSNLVAKAFISFYSSSNVLLSSSSRGTIVSTTGDVWNVSSAVDTAPSSAAYARLGVAVYSMAANNLGTIWVDNVRLMQLD